MIRVEKINSAIFPTAMEFLKTVPSIENVDEKILNNACIAYENDKIVGCISFEEFSEKGLIRYFVFKKVLSIEYLEELLNALEQQAKKENILMLVCIAESAQIEELFTSLGFQPVEKKMIFINEENVENSNFKKALFLYKQLDQ